MNEFEQKIKSARRGYKRKLMGIVCGGLLLVTLLSLIYFTHSLRFQITPELAAERAAVTLSEGFGMVLADTAYIVGARATLRVVANGFITEDVRVDIGARQAETETETNAPLMIDLRAAPMRVTISTTPSHAQTKWRVNGGVAAAAERFVQQLPVGETVIEVEHEFYRRETLRIHAQPGKEYTEHVQLTPVSGVLRLDSEPQGATVSVGGAQRGITPLELAAVGGVHQITVALPGFETITEDISLTNRAPTIERNYRLQAPSATMRIAVSPPGGMLRVNGALTAANTTLSLPTDDAHVVQYGKPGYVAQTQTVSLSANQTTTVQFALQEESGEVLIQSTPTANILLNGNPAGRTPQTFRLPTVPHRITLQRNGYRSVQRSVTPTAETTLLVDETLVTEAAARLAQARPWLQVAGVKMKLFNPNHQRRNRFTMGAPRSETGSRANEFERAVELNKPFYISVTEITEAQFAQYQPKPTPGGNQDHPARNVTWLSAAGFCNWLSAQAGLQPAYQIVDGKLRGFDANADGYRLPSEAEWEWLARVAGRAQTARFVWGDATTIPARSGNFADESAKGHAPKYIPRYTDHFAGVAPVASFVADPNGLYDMAGNVSEWVHDRYNLQPPAPGRVEENPFGGQHESEYENEYDAARAAHVVKGASFRSASITSLRSSFREGLATPRDDVGFRVARYLYGKPPQ